MPSLWLIFLYLFIKNKFLKKITIIIFLILSIAPTLPIVSTYIEKFLHYNHKENYIMNLKPSYILILGAGADETGKPYKENFKRAEIGIELSKKYSVPIIFSGGEDADKLPNFFELNEDDYIKEVESLNTYGTAINLKKIIKSSDRILLLVTSPNHYRRAIITLKNNNFIVKIPNNNDYNFDYNYSLIPTFSSVSNFNNHVYEILALIWYYLSGKI
tara:strand:- start:440 stop:1087 length:648 start_codon:yes stop_codon:yes gene_type:complete